MEKPTMYYAVGELGSHDGMFDGYDILASAGVAWDNPGAGFTMHIPDAKTLFVDSGGFQAVKKWDLEYPYQASDYFWWAEEIGADYVALPDYACEPDLHSISVKERIQKTIEHHHIAYNEYLSGDYTFEIVPVVQGWVEGDYRYCIRTYQDMGLPLEYCSIGTVCKRNRVDPIHRCLSVLESESPGTNWHLFGLTLNGWKDTRLWGRFRSADTGAWRYMSRSKEHRKKMFESYDSKVSDIQSRIAEQSMLG